MKTTVLQWNVHYSNKDAAAMAEVIGKNNPEVVGLCELTAPMGDMARALSAATGRNFEAQPGRDGWVGYGADMFYDADKWEALDGGVEKAACSSIGGPRAVNWVVLKERKAGALLIAGGTHTSYCAEGCDTLHGCELGALYAKFEQLKAKHSNAPVVWMGDLNRGVDSTVVQDMLRGRVAGKTTFEVDDLAKTKDNTYFEGGSAIDHIFGDHGAFEVLEGGGTGQGVQGMHLSGSDHFPVYVKMQFGGK